MGVTNGVGCTILGLVGDTISLDIDKISMEPHVERVMRVQEPYKKANRKFHPEDTIVRAGEAVIGGGNFSVIAGPCSVESEEQVVGIAEAVKASGAAMLRGGAFKPRTSPYSFQGMGTPGLDLLLEAKKATGLPIVSKLWPPGMWSFLRRRWTWSRSAPEYAELRPSEGGGQDVQAHPSQAWPLQQLRGVDHVRRVHHERGNENVILCERGIRTFETYTRNTLDLSAIPAVKKMSHLPIIVDPSHAAGMAWMVEPLAMAAIAAGADGLIIEVHNDPPTPSATASSPSRPLSLTFLCGRWACWLT